MQTLWKFPFPTSGLAGDEVSCDVRRGDKIVLTIQVNEERRIELRFTDVYAVRCTFDQACTLEMIEAYGALIDVGESEFLKSAIRQIKDTHHSIIGLRHLSIYFDDGPCFDFICRNFSVDPKNFPVHEEPNWGHDAH